MAYKRNPVYYFNGSTETGIDKVPNGSQVVYYNGSGAPQSFIKKNNTGLTNTTGIEAAITAGVALESTSNTGTVSSLSDLGINASATELNYVDGVTSSIQTQLNGKATTDASSLTTGTISYLRLPNASSGTKGASRIYTSGSDGYIYTS